MRNLKKFLALVLAMVMAFSLMLTVNAANPVKNFSDATSVTPEFVEAADVLTGMKVFQGDEGGFRPGDTIIRAEVAALIYRLDTGDVENSRAQLYANYGNFTDVAESDWFAGYVGYCANKGLIKGTSPTTFDPYAPVTGYETLTMILRAIGYDKNGEFTGPDWQTNVSALATNLGVLNNIKTTHYGDTLYLASRRDVVAELLFQSVAYVPMVTYTTAFGYQTTGMEGGVVGTKTNPTLGYRIFGLTSNVGVVVGNQATGETTGTTKIGFSLKSARTTSELDGNWNMTPGAGISGITQGFINTNQVSFVTAIDDSLGITTTGRTAPDAGGQTQPSGARSAYNYASDRTSQLPGNVTRTFKFDTDLRLFNHALKVWYDNRSGQNETVGNGVNGTAQFTTNLTTYAYFDKATNVAVVSAQTADISYDNRETAGSLYTEATNNKESDADVNNNWKAPGFTLRTGDLCGADTPDGTVGPREFATYFNYSFGPMGANSYDDDAATANSAVSPVKNNDDDTISNSQTHPLYLLISNSANKELDVVISLDMTMTKIVQNNNTTKPYSVGPLTANDSTVPAGAGKQYFGVTADNGALNVNGVVGTDRTYTSLAQANLKNDLGKDIVTALNTRVAAIEITGTAGGNALDRNGTAGQDNWGFAKPQDPLTSSYYYQLTENTLSKTATVIKVDYASQDVTLSDGSVLHQSVFAEATDATFTTNVDASQDYANPDRILQSGKTYTFTLDEQGNYIYWSLPSNTAEFVYGTYIDFTTQVASSTFNYPLVYVSQTGEAKQQSNIKSVEDAETDAVGTRFDLSMGYEAYTRIRLPKRDNNVNVSGPNTSGFVKGRYVGYALDSSGNLDAVGDGNVGSYFGSQDTGFLMADTTNFGAARVEIDSVDVSITAKSVDTANKLYLTNNTMFYLVDGAGTDNQTVTPYKGLAELMAGCDKVTIYGRDGGRSAYGGTAITSSYIDNPEHNPYEMIYYRAGDFEYAQNYDPSAQEIKTVFIPKCLVDFDKSVDDTLMFIGDSDSTLVNAVGSHATQYTMYNKEGVAGNYWISGWENEANTASAVINQFGDNVFYRLVETGSTAADGNKIYTLREVADTQAKASKVVIGQYFEGTLTNPNLQVTLDPNGVSIPNVVDYYATTYSSQVGYICDPNNVNTDFLYNVGAATVKNLDKTTYPGINDTLTALNNASSLQNNVGVPVSCVLNPADTNYRTVSVIFVNA